jgi:hypothetical protein
VAITAKHDMSTTRNGKIARLPQNIRNQLNRRLEDGEPGKEVVKWLNTLPIVQAVLKEQFDGQPVNEPNLVAWRQGGYQEWLEHQERCGIIQRLREEAEELKVDAEDVENLIEEDVSEYFAVKLETELVRMAETLLKETGDPQERWRRLREALHELGQLRRQNHRAARLHRDKCVWRREDERKTEEENKQRLTDMVFSKMRNEVVAEGFGGGEYGKKMADLLHRIRFDLPFDDPIDSKPSDKTGSETIKPDKAGLSSIKPDKAKNSAKASETPSQNGAEPSPS